MIENRKTKIICTIGPVSESKEMMTKLVENGMNIIRLNFSHGDYEEHGNRINNIREVVKETGKNVAILLDTKGPEVRLGDFENKQETYEKGDEVTIVREKILGTHEKFHIQCPEIFNDVEVGGTILIDDGKCRLTILEKKEGELRCRIENPHTLKSRKGCNLPGVKLSMPFVSAKDDADIRFGCKMGVDYIAASFTRRKEDVLAIRKILEEEGRPDIQIIPKIENQEGFDNLREILEVADGVMVARGDLGVDVSFELVPLYQKQIIKTANELGKPVVTATHMLETMQQNPRPTRAEASDVANAVLDGTDAIMLSGESAAGDYPVEAVQTMDRIAKAMEPTLPYHERLKNAMKTSQRTKNDAIAISVADTSMTLDVAAVIAFTQSGNTARRISKYRPKAPVIAVTFDERTQRSLAMNWGVTTVLSEVANNQNNECELARTIAKEHGIKDGETIILVAGYPVGCGATNTMKIIEV
ncbi:pyruvate kinase [Amedibacterium intestinale]|jgi:pyruvate kinase|uniref:pyruvate kinase n=1 Tax=Amedibacterium intestinale TaxID=2583452 RepID=UPI001373B222|nr:pyruvate kinase [Amedibacterium intestinale]BBK61467.1 pyruvate kinase [Amedibacterium intestinale]